MYFYIPWGILAYVKISPRFIGLQLVAPPPPTPPVLCGFYYYYYYYYYYAPRS